MPDREATVEGDAPSQQAMQRSTRDPEVLRAGLERWLTDRLGAAASPQVTGVASTSANGMSSETVLLEASWTDGGRTRHERLVARIAPDPADVPVFPSYDLGRQYEVMRLVGELTDVPVPRLHWLEQDPHAIGAPFFVMDRADGVVPPDVLPYPFGDNWLYDADRADQTRLQESSVGVLAQLYGITGAAERFAFLEWDVPGDTALRRHVAHTRDWYEYAVAGKGRSALVEDGFRWLERHWPAHEGPTVVSWGDARIGNVLYRDFEPVAVLDWEMAGLGPPELDVAWMVAGHEVFQHIAGQLGLEGMPHFLRLDDVAATYEQRTGYALRDLGWHLTYAAVQWGIVFLRTGVRQVHFGEQAMPDDPDDLLHHRRYLEALLDGAPGD